MDCFLVQITTIMNITYFRLFWSVIIPIVYLVTLIAIYMGYKKYNK